MKALSNLSLLIGLAIISQGAYAEWSLIRESANSYHYVDKATLSRDGEVRRIWWLMNLKPQLVSVAGVSSIVGYAEINCESRQSRTLESTSLLICTET